MIYDNTNGEPTKIEASVDAKGLTKVDVTYVANTLKDAWGVAPGEYEGLGRVSLQLRMFGGGAYTVVGSYEGNIPENTGSGGKTGEELATYELDFTQAQKPVQVHPNFITKKTGLYDVYKWGELKDGKGVGNGEYGFQETCPAGVTPVVGSKGKEVNPLYGVTDWLDVGAIWRKSWMAVDSDIPDSLFKNLGLIDVPEGPVPPVHQGRNWLRSAAKARGRGKSWELSIEWMLSGRDGHEPAIYKSNQ